MHKPVDILMGFVLGFGALMQCTCPPITTEPWTIAYSDGMPPQMAGTGPWTFDFPTAPGSVHYVYSDHEPVALGQTVTMVFSIEASDGAVFVAEDGCTPPQMHIFLQRKGDNLSGSGKYEWYRLWSTFQFAILQDTGGDATLSVVLTPDQLTGVYGKHPTQAQMDDTLANLEHAGFTFGACYWGHGVHMQQGAAKFTLKSYVVGN